MRWPASLKGLDNKNLITKMQIFFKVSQGNSGHVVPLLSQKPASKNLCPRCSFIVSFRHWSNGQNGTQVWNLLIMVYLAMARPIWFLVSRTRPTQNFGNPPPPPPQKKRGVAMYGQIAAVRGYSLHLTQCSLQPLSGPELLWSEV